MANFFQTLFGGSSSKQKSQSGLDPRFGNLFFGNVDAANQVANNLDARQIAGMSSDWNSGADIVRNNATNGAGFGSLNSAAQSLGAATGYRPQQVQAAPKQDGGRACSGRTR